MVISPEWNYKVGIDRCFMFASHCLFTAAVRSVPQLLVVFHDSNHVFLIDGLVTKPFSRWQYYAIPFSSARLPSPLTHLTCIPVLLRCYTSQPVVPLSNRYMTVR